MSQLMLEEDVGLCLRADPSSRLGGRLTMPGDKSISHRALILGAMAEGETRIEGLLESDDVLRTAAAVQALGARVARIGPTHWTVNGGAWRSPDETIDLGNSGTAVRLLLGAIAGRRVRARLTGDSSLRRRPMGRVVEPLRAMGARIEGDDRLPIEVQGGDLQGLNWKSPVASAQLKSAVLLAGLAASGRTEIIEPSPSRDHMENMLRAFGARVESDDVATGRRIRIAGGQPLRGTQLMVPGDPSSAAFPLVAALITPGSEVIVHGVLVNPLRFGLFTTLIEMGADLQISNHRRVGGELVADIRARSSALNGIEVPADRVPSMVDEYPILAIAAACAVGQTAMYGLSELRVKESDRLGAMLSGLRACGISAGCVGDSLLVDGCDGSPPGGAAIATGGDHRIAMSFLVLGLASRTAVSVDQAGMIATSFPGFAPLMASLGARIAETEE